INIIYQFKKIKTDLASGYEKFIINLCIRLAINELLSCSKMNCFLIDEGWQSLDNKNRNMILKLIEYINKKYEHVIIISHLNEIKECYDYIISINVDSKNQSYLTTNYGQ